MPDPKQRSLLSAVEVVKSGSDEAASFVDGSQALAVVLVSPQGVGIAYRVKSDKSFILVGRAAATMLAKQVGPDRAMDLIRDAIYGTPEA